VPATVNPRLPLLLNKVPEVTAIFWVIKILSTTVGETGADYLAVHVGLGASATTVIMVGFLVAALALQLRARSYVPWIYWLTVVLVSVVGTQITDLLTDKLEISLYLSTAVFAATLAATFAIWYGVEQTLSIHTIVTRRRELFYWGAILFTGNGGRGSGDRSPRPRLPARRRRIWRADRGHRPRLQSRRQSGSHLLAGLHPHAPAGRFAR
jgi:uncharacterized membrane-anchored protein